MKATWRLDLCAPRRAERGSSCSVGLFTCTTCVWWYLQAGIKRILHYYKCKKLKRIGLLVTALGRRRLCTVSCCLFSEPSGMPAGVWARSVSASEIEVNWQALSFSPERVLGYEVLFTLLNGNRNHTHTPQFKCLSSPRCTSEPPLTAKILHFFVPKRQENISEHFKENKSKIASPHAFSCCSW